MKQNTISVGVEDLPTADDASEQIASPLLTTEETAAYLRMSREWLEKQRSYPRTRIPSPKFTRVGRRVFYRKSELDAFIERNTAASTGEYVAS